MFPDFLSLKIRMAIFEDSCRTQARKILMAGTRKSSLCLDSIYAHFIHWLLTTSMRLFLRFIGKLENLNVIVSQQEIYQRKSILNQSNFLHNDPNLNMNKIRNVGIIVTAKVELLFCNFLELIKSGSKTKF